MFDPKHWRLEDPCPAKPLGQIIPLSLRAWSALVRSKDKTVFERGFLNLVGAVDMMRGLDYHHDNFCAIINAIAEVRLLDPVSKQKKLMLIHEAVAYLNRLGQFYHFASSDFVTTAVNNWKSIIPTIIKFKRFRDKHSAHRSLDKPRQDSPHLQQVHAWALSSLGGCLFSPKPGRSISIAPKDILNAQKMWTDSYLCFQLVGDEDNETLNLSIEREHPVFVREAYDLIFRLLSLS